MSKLVLFWQELKRRNVVRRNTVYAATAFVILELVSIIQEPLNLPNWTLLLVIILLSIGLVISVVLSWIYDMTPEGLHRTEPISKQAPEKEYSNRKNGRGWRIATFISVILIAGLVLLNILNSVDKVDLSGLEKSIAVLPFENLGSNENDLTLHQAIPIALIMELNNVEDFVVRPRGSTLKYGNTTLSSPQIGLDLKANFLVKGFIQQQDAIALIDIMLIKATSDEVIWNHSYEMEMKDIFQVRSDISKQVATSLKNSFIPVEKDLTENPDAYLAFLSGLNYYWRDEKEANYRRAVTYFQKAVQLDPEFTMAYAKLSTAHSFMYHFHYDRTDERLALASRAIENALSIKPNDPDVVVAEGVRSYVVLEYPGALEKFKLAEGLATDEIELYVCLGSLYRRQMDLDLTLEYYLKAAELDPQNLVLTDELGETYLIMRNYEMAEKYFNHYLSIDSSPVAGLISKLRLYYTWERGIEKSRKILSELKIATGEITDDYHMLHAIRVDLVDGNYDDAIHTLTTIPKEVISNQFVYIPKALFIAEVYQAMDLTKQAAYYYDSVRIHLESRIAEDPDDFRFRGSLGVAYAGLGEKEKAIEEGKLAVELMPFSRDFYRGFFSLEALALIYSMTGDIENSVEILDRLLRMPGLISVNLLKKDPAWKALWGTSAFEQLLESHTKS